MTIASSSDHSFTAVSIGRYQVAPMCQEPLTGQESKDEKRTFPRGLLCESDECNGVTSDRHHGMASENVTEEPFQSPVGPFGRR